VPGASLAFVGSRAKRIAHVQDLEVDAAFELGLVRSRLLRKSVLRIERWLLSHFQIVASVSARMLDRLAEKGIPEKKLMLLPNWIRTEEIRPGTSKTTFRFEWSVSADSVVALYAGSIGEKQGMETLLDAASQLENERQLCFIVCSQGPHYERLKGVYGHLSNVIWRDLVPSERLGDLLNLADIHLLPQRADAADLVMPSKLTGMFASGRPVVATALPGTQVAEAVTERGLVVPPGDSRELAKAIWTLAYDQPLRERMGAAAREYAVSHFDMEQILDRFQTELGRLVRDG
jgi:colanic acid biosynthesis glycosyl transferase WcaI